MSTTRPAVENSTESRSIESERFEQAFTEPMTVERECERPDAEYRGDRYVCKHAIRCLLVEPFENTVSTELVARVVQFAIAKGCPVNGHGGRCKGPLGRTGSLPCPTCCDAIRTEGVSEWKIWTTLNRKQEAC